MEPIQVEGSGPCGCGGRKEDLRKAGIEPLITDRYTALDFFQWLQLKARTRDATH